MFVKICANTNLDDALLAASLGADAVGFVFAPSRRQVSCEQVAAIVDRLPREIETVGIFATTDPAAIEPCLAASRLSIAQLHGEFDAALVRRLAQRFGAALKVIQTVAYAVDAVDAVDADDAFGVDGHVSRDAQFVATLQAVFAEPGVWAVLVDAARAGASGGLGVAFDWRHVGSLVERAIGRLEPRPRVILAGGLTAENVAEAIAAFQPWGVDVASGVEASAGKKDAARLRAFLEAARRAEPGERDTSPHDF